MRINEIIERYTTREATLEETNAKLEELGANFRLDPDKNVIQPGEEDRFGLLDTGTGTFDKVEVQDGKLVNCDCGEMYALCIYAGKTYVVQGDTLVE